MTSDLVLIMAQHTVGVLPICGWLVPHLPNAYNTGNNWINPSLRDGEWTTVALLHHQQQLCAAIIHSLMDRRETIESSLPWGLFISQTAATDAIELLTTISARSSANNNLMESPLSNSQLVSSLATAVLVKPEMPYARYTLSGVLFQVVELRDQTFPRKSSWISSKCVFSLGANLRVEIIRFHRILKDTYSRPNTKADLEFVSSYRHTETCHLNNRSIPLFYVWLRATQQTSRVFCLS